MKIRANIINDYTLHHVATVVLVSIDRTGQFTKRVLQEKQAQLLIMITFIFKYVWFSCCYSLQHYYFSSKQNILFAVVLCWRYH